MVCPVDWDEFVSCGEFEKIQNILEADGWRLKGTLASGVVVMIPERIDQDQSDGKR